MATSQQTDNVITLRGSVDIVTEFFYYSINSILYQRGIYPAENFIRESKWGLTVLTTNDETLKKYLNTVVQQMEGWLTNGDLQRMVLVVTGTDSGQTLERWAFNVTNERPVLKEGSNAPLPRRSLKDIQTDIKAIIRQITSSVTFLPLLNEPCEFDLLVYTNSEAAVPKTWEESDPKHVENSSTVWLRSFTTKVHKVDGLVAFKNDSEDL